MFLHRCQPTRLGSDKSKGAWKTKTKTGFKALSCFLLLSVSLFLASTGELAKNHLKKEKNNNNHSNCNAAASQHRELLQRRSILALRAAPAPQRCSAAASQHCELLQRRSVAAPRAAAAP
jgi:hypothetical protein